MESLKPSTLLIAQGENIKYIQAQLGHAKAFFTLDIYALDMGSMNQEAACRLEDAVFGNYTLVIASRTAFVNFIN